MKSNILLRAFHAGLADTDEHVSQQGQVLSPHYDIIINSQIQQTAQLKDKWHKSL